MLEFISMVIFPGGTDIHDGGIAIGLKWKSSKRNSYFKEPAFPGNFAFPIPDKIVIGIEGGIAQFYRVIGNSHIKVCSERIECKAHRILFVVPAVYIKSKPIVSAPAIPHISTGNDIGTII